MTIKDFILLNIGIKVFFGHKVKRVIIRIGFLLLIRQTIRLLKVCISPWIVITKRFQNGLLVESVYKGKQRQDHWVQNKPHAPYLFLLAVGEYEIIEDSLKNRSKHLPILYYVESAYKQETLEALKHTPEMIDFMEKLLDYAYPWAKYAQIFVREFIAGGMENTSATVLNYQFLKNKVDSTVYQRLIIHELAHQWFGNLITPESWANIVLSEGFASYMEYLWFRHKYGKAFAEMGEFEQLVGIQKFFTQIRRLPSKKRLLSQ